MRQEALKRAPDVVYLDTYKLFSDINGGYSRDILDENGKTITARIPDGVHFTDDGAEYLARAVFSLLDVALEPDQAGRPAPSDRLDQRARQR